MIFLWNVVKKHLTRCFVSVNIPKTLLLTMPKISKEQVLTAITSWYFDDLDFIEKVNDITFHQKRKLQALKAGKNFTSHKWQNKES